MPKNKKNRGFFSFSLAKVANCITLYHYHHSPQPTATFFSTKVIVLHPTICFPKISKLIATCMIMRERRERYFLGIFRSTYVRASSSTRGGARCAVRVVQVFAIRFSYSPMTIRPSPAFPREKEPSDSSQITAVLAATNATLSKTLVTTSRIHVHCRFPSKKE